MTLRPDDGPDGHWIRLCRLAEVPSAGGLYVERDGRAYAVFRDGDGVRVIDDRCPHAGGTLSAGRVDRDGCVVCPWHGWPFALDSGQCPDNPAIAVRTWLAQIDHGDVLIPRSL
jgi:nitrite reductase/ring-hydroxylating ferredoxin subunit